jgi:hypothetical protein
MSLLEALAAFQESPTPQTPSANPPAEGYFIVALIAVVLGFLAWIFIRSSARHSTKE